VVPEIRNNESDFEWGGTMRDRHFITWLVGLIATPVLLTMFPQYEATFAFAVPMVLGAAALLGMIVMMVTGQFERSDEHQTMHHMRRIPVRAQRLLSHLR
jgi:hypothetical protein